MRVSVMGQAAFGKAVLERLASDGIDIAGVSAPAPTGSRADPLWDYGRERGLAVVDTATLKEADGQAAWRALGADICVMAFVTDILPDEVFDDAKLGTIQFHPSLLPAHRGSSAIAWAIIHGDAETGVTIFWPDRGIDTGPILLQERCPIEPTDTVASLYFGKLFPMGVDALSRAVAMVAAGDAPRIEQQHERSTYEPPLADRHCEIPWYDTPYRVERLIRGANPTPGAWTTYQDKRLRLFEVELPRVPLAPGMPGRVLAVGDDGIDVRLNYGTVLRVKRVAYDGGAKMAAGEWAASAGLEPGHRFR